VRSVASTAQQLTSQPAGQPDQPEQQSASQQPAWRKPPLRCRK
jgi:hypothetical protein